MLRPPLGTVADVLRRISLEPRQLLVGRVQHSSHNRESWIFAGEASLDWLSLDRRKPRNLHWCQYRTAKSIGGRKLDWRWTYQTVAAATLGGAVNSIPVLGGQQRLHWEQQQELHVHSNLGCVCGIVNIREQEALWTLLEVRCHLEWTDA